MQLRKQVRIHLGKMALDDILPIIIDIVLRGKVTETLPTSLPQMTTFTILFCMSYSFSFALLDLFQFVWRYGYFGQHIIKTLHEPYCPEQFYKGS